MPNKYIGHVFVNVTCDNNSIHENIDKLYGELENCASNLHVQISPPNVSNLSKVKFSIKIKIVCTSEKEINNVITNAYNTLAHIIKQINKNNGFWLYYDDYNCQCDDQYYRMLLRIVPNDDPNNNYLGYPIYCPSKFVAVETALPDSFAPSVDQLFTQMQL